MACFLSCFGHGPRPVYDEWEPRGVRKGEEKTREQLKADFDESIRINEGRLIVSGIFARANSRNNNKRIYPKSVLKREVARFEREHISLGSALGEVDHPNYSSRYFRNLNLPNISHQVLEVHWEGDCLMGSIEILPTPSGLLLWELYSQGIRLGVSSRGWASLRADPKTPELLFVDDDFELITFDFVTEPSTMDAFLFPILMQYKGPIPYQTKRVQISHLGHGTCGMEIIRNLPDPVALSTRINQLQLQGNSLLCQPSNGLNAPHLSNLDKLLIYSHYIVFSDQPYLDREANARDLHSHLTMFATRAHLSGVQPVMKKAEINEYIATEMSRSSNDITSSSADTASSNSSRVAHQNSSAISLSTPHHGAGSSSEATTRYEAEPYPGRSASNLNASQRPDSRGARPSSRNTRPWTKSNRVHPEPVSIKRPPESVTREFKLIRSTLKRYAAELTKEQSVVWSICMMQAAPTRPQFPWSRSSRTEANKAQHQ